MHYVEAESGWDEIREISWLPSQPGWPDGPASRRWGRLKIEDVGAWKLPILGGIGWGLKCFRQRPVETARDGVWLVDGTNVRWHLTPRFPPVRDW